MSKQQAQQEVDELVRKLRKLSVNLTKDSREAFKQAAPLLVSAIAGRAPVSDETHYRYLNGKRVASYAPGNLKRSIRIMTFGKSPAVFVAAKLAKGDTKGDFRGSRVDAWYAHLVEFGAPAIGVAPQPFVAPAVEAVGDTVLRLSAEFLRRKISQLNR